MRLNLKVDTTEAGSCSAITTFPKLKTPTFYLGTWLLQ